MKWNIILQVLFFQLIGLRPYFFNHRNNLVYGNNLLQKIAYCELESIRLGTELGDTFNSAVGSDGWGERLYQSFIAKNLGFAGFMSKGLHNSGLTLTKENSKSIQESAGWIGKSISDSPYNVLNHKWVYMFGDSTTRQIWAR